MFDKIKFSNILKQINETYNSMTEFAQKASFDRTYISKYINLKLDNPPTPKILKKIAQSSNNIVSYPELMNICGYIDKNNNPYIQTLNQKVGFLNDTRNDLEAIGLNNKQIWEFQMLCCIDFSDNEYEKNMNNFLNTLNSNQKKALNEYLKKLKLELSDNKKIQESLYNSSSKKYYMCPVYGQISAGQPNWAEENIEGRLPIDTDLMDIINPEEYFFLRVNGESMNNVVRNGAFALIHKQDMVEDGEIAVVLVNGYDATLKHFTKKGDVIVLEPDSNDSSFKTQIYDKTTPIKILGKYVGKMEINK